MREISEKEFIHERLGERFESATSDHDTRRRVRVLVDEFLTDDMIAGKKVLDVGTGLGFFAQRLEQRGAIVTAVDIGETLLARVRQRVGCECLKVDALGLQEYFGTACFDAVVSSECIEHTPAPDEALRQMAAVLKPGGYLSVSTPNILWYPAVRLATVLGIRPFDGLEHFSSFRSINRTLEQSNIRVLKQKGLHLFPFQFKMHGLSTFCDEHFQGLRDCMINACVLGVRN